MEKIDLNDLNKQFQGIYLKQLLTHHVRRFKKDKSAIYLGLYGTLNLLPSVIQDKAYDFIDKYNDPMIRNTLINSETPAVLTEIIDDVKTTFKKYSKYLDEETFFNIFQIVILSYAYSEADKKSQNKIFLAKGSQPLISNYHDISNMLTQVIQCDDEIKANSLLTMAEKIYNATIKYNEIYLGIVKGLNKGIMLTEHDLTDAICFPKRFLKIDCTDYLEPDEAKSINTIIEYFFFLGFIGNLLISTFPTRDKVPKIDMKSFYKKWALPSLLADKQVGGYDRLANGSYSIVFKYYYQNHVMPVLKTQSKLGFFTLNKCQSFFNWLFYSGVYLGSCLDLTSKGSDFTTIK
jgi:hypothetical protein